jgi:hypothetical protein
MPVSVRSVELMFEFSEFRTRFPEVRTSRNYTQVQKDWAALSDCSDLVIGAQPGAVKFSSCIMSR